MSLDRAFYRLDEPFASARQAATVADLLGRSDHVPDTITTQEPHMSHHEYEAGKAISGALDPPFYALIFAAMRKADTQNYARLREAFPAVERELVARYNAPGGVLADDTPPPPVPCGGRKRVA